MPQRGNYNSQSKAVYSRLRGREYLSKSAFTLEMLIPVPEIWRVMCQIIYPKLHIQTLKLCISRYGSELITRRAKRCIPGYTGENTLSKSALTFEILIPVHEIQRLMCKFIYPKLHIQTLKLCISLYGSETITPRSKRCIPDYAGENTLSESALSFEILIPVPEIWRITCQFIYLKLHIKTLRLCISRPSSETISRRKKRCIPDS